MPDPSIHIDRRTFLRGVAVAATGALVGNALASDRTAPLGVGIIEVASEHHPGLAGALRRGFEAGLASGAPDRAIELATTASGPSPSRLAAAIERLAESGRMALLIAPVGPVAAGRLAPLLARIRTPLLAVGSGADSVRADERSPWIVHLTLQQWQASWALGAWAAERAGTVAVATSLFAGGYDHLYAFRSAVTAHGGRLVGTVVSDAATGRHDLDGTLDRLERLRPRALYPLYPDAFAQRLAAATAQRPALAGSLLLGTGLTGPITGAAAERSTRVTAWSPRLANDASWTFLTRAGRRPEGVAAGFTLLGYEAAQIAQRLLEAIGDRAAPERLAAALPTLTGGGPRGRTRYLEAAGRLDAPLYLEVGGRAPAPLPGAVGEHHPALRALHRAPRSGWLTDYPFR
jgi:ABC-type branched-subunit amino acid transport system substrate-binding protein